MSRKIIVIGGGGRLNMRGSAIALALTCSPVKVTQDPPFWSADYRNKRGKR